MDQHAELFAKLSLIFQDALDQDDLVLTPQTKAADVDGWDSLAHIRLMLAVERAFAIKFTASEVGSLKNVGDLVRLITSKC